MGLFGYKKDKVEEGLRRSTKAVLIGGIVHIDDVEKLKLNEEASAELYAESQAHLIYCIGTVFNNKIIGKKKWATPQFMEECIKREVEIFEKTNNLHPGMLTSILFKRLYEIESMTQKQRAKFEHVKDSAKRVYNKDPSANIQQLENFIGGFLIEFSKIIFDRF